MGRQSRATLQQATITMQEELEERINEGLVARVKRYFSDGELRKRLAVAKGTKATIEALKARGE